MKVLIIGSGGREHALAWKLAQSPLVSAVFCAPGNGGTASMAKNVSLAADDIPGLLQFALKEHIRLTVVGPEQPLALGIVNAFTAAGLTIFGPTKEAAEIESSKVFCRALLQQANVSQPAFRVFEQQEEAEAWVRQKGCPLVVKADGLAAGKGVVVAETEEEALSAVRRMMQEKAFGSAGNKILVEEKLSGQEASFHCLVDGTNVIPLAPAQDHKRIHDGDAGENTGGMGAYSPTPALSPLQEIEVLNTIVQPTVTALKEQGREFRGVLYAGLMVNERGIFLIEFNARFGDPETQVIIPRVSSDLLPVLLACAQGSLAHAHVGWKQNAAACVVLASAGYPGAHESGKEIRGLNIAKGLSNTLVFHAGTKMRQGAVYTNGGRVLSVVGLGSDVRAAVDNAYAGVKKISFAGMQFRKDIAHHALP